MEKMENIDSRRGASSMLAAVTTALLAVVAQSAVAASTMKFTGFEFGSVDVKIAAIPAAPISHANIGA